jgi:hypothetical protein
VTLQIPKHALAIALALVFIAAAGAGGYFIGFAAADRDAAFDRGQSAGRTAGLKAGEQKGHATGYEAGQDETRAEFRAGTPNYERIFNRGRKAGAAAGRVAGYEAGTARAFSGFDGGWEIGNWYVVHFGQPTGDERYNINSRVPMETGQTYHICPDDTDEICGGDL